MFPILIPAATVLIALSLGAMQARAQVLRYALAPPAERSSIASLTSLVTLGAWITNAAWLFATWPWYAALLMVAAALSTGNWVSTRSLTSWESLKYLIAMATLASAGLLWTAFCPAGH